MEVDDRGFIRVDKQLRTNVPHIFAIGDIVGQPMLAHKGVHEGHVAAEVIAGKKHYFDPKVIPSIAYTEPEVAWVGLTEKEAKEKGISYETATFPWAASGRAIASDCADGMTKLIFDKESHRVIGGAIVGTNGGELLGEIGPAIEMGCDAEDIALTIHAHPTLHESVGRRQKCSKVALPTCRTRKRRRSNFFVCRNIRQLKKRLTTPLFTSAIYLSSRLLAPRSERRSRTADRCSLFSLTVWLLSFRRCGRLS